MNQPLDRSPMDSVRAHVRERITAFLDHAQAGGEGDAEFNQARLALECLPLSRGEYATAINRLMNARSYFHAGESGAARFELRLLLGGLETGTFPVSE
jgi:hypothetical protein